MFWPTSVQACRLMRTERKFGTTNLQHWPSSTSTRYTDVWNYNNLTILVPFQKYQKCTLMVPFYS
jgi:hypothetical protein